MPWIYQMTLVLTLKCKDSFHCLLESFQVYLINCIIDLTTDYSNLQIAAISKLNPGWVLDPWQDLAFYHHASSFNLVEQLNSHFPRSTVTSLNFPPKLPISVY